MSCPARILVWSSRTSVNGATGIASCTLEDHDLGRPGWHLGRIEGYPPSLVVNWSEDDRRHFTGDFHLCPEKTCLLPEGHPGDHAQ